MTMYEKFKKLDIDFSQLGLEQGDTHGDYFCTPKGAEVIGGADGPTAIILADGKTGHPQAVCSALRFEIPKQIEWRMVFYQKTVEDMKIDLPLQ